MKQEKAKTSIGFSVKTTDLELTSNISRHIEKTIKSLDRFVKNMDAVVWASIEISRTSRHHKSGKIYRAEIQIHLPGKLMRSEAISNTIFRAINETRGDLQRELKQYRGKKISIQKRGFRKLKRIIKGKVRGQ